MRPILLCLALVFLAAPSLPAQGAKKKTKPHCDFPDLTAPQALTGEAGDRVKYHLLWYTDVDDLGKKYKYVRTVSNLKDYSLLPCKWEKAQIEFKEIAGNDCGVNYFESTHSHKEERGTKIEFGNRLEHSTNNASLFIIDENSPPRVFKGAECYEEQNQDRDALRSKIATGPYSFQFSSSVNPETNAVSYTAYGFDSSRKKPVMFKIDGLLVHLNGVNKNLKKTVNWKESQIGEARVFTAAQSSKSKEAVFTVGSLGDYKIVEKTFQVEIVNNDVQVMAKGLVTIHVPVKR